MTTRLNRGFLRRFLLLYVFFVSPVAAQTSGTVFHSPLARELAGRGFENLIARTSKQATVVAFEDSRYRYSIRGMQEAILRTIYRLPTSSEKVVFVVKKYGEPLVAFESTEMATGNTPDKLKLPLLSQSSVANDISRVMPWPITNPSRFKTDLIMHPDLKASFGEYDNPVAVQFNIMPEIRTLLTKGLLFSGSILVPLVNELGTTGDYVRLGPTHLNYLGRLPHQLFWYVNAGYFWGDRYGLHGGLTKFFYSGTLQLETRAGYTGYTTMEKGVFVYDPLQDLTYSISGTLFMRRLQLFFKAGYHRFLKADQGFRFDLFRYFYEFRFGLWATAANNEYNGGFRVSIPLPPRQYAVRKTFRIRPASYFELGYQGRRNTQSGQVLHANELFDEMHIRYHPAYLESNLGRLKSKRKQ